MNKNIKVFFIGLILSYVGELCPTSAAERVMNIGDITPVKDGMSKEEAKEAILSFLKNEVFKPENEIKQGDIISDTTKAFGARTAEKSRIITLKDGTQWIAGDKGLQRFLGALYLKKAIEHHGLHQWRAVETKFILKNTGETITIQVKKSQDDPLKNIFTINSDKFISFSRYIGDDKVTNTDLEKILGDLIERHAITHATGFFDMGSAGEYPNLRIQDHKITLIDTEYSSFKNANKVQPPSEKTELELGGTTFTFPINELMGK